MPTTKTPPRQFVLISAALATLALLAACGSTSSPGGNHPQGTHTMPDGTVMSDSQMKGMQAQPSPSTPAGTQPLATARMVCSTEIANTVQRTYGLSSRPTGSGSWSQSTREYTCRYPLTHSVLTLSVKDLDQPHLGRAYFNAIRTQLGGSPILGLENLGFPAFENTHGQVGFLKDSKTLLVDGRSVGRGDLQPGSNRTESAYGVAAAVIACWKE